MHRQASPLMTGAIESDLALDMPRQLFVRAQRESEELRKSRATGSTNAESQIEQAAHSSTGEHPT